MVPLLYTVSHLPADCVWRSLPFCVYRHTQASFCGIMSPRHLRQDGESSWAGSFEVTQAWAAGKLSIFIPPEAGRAGCPCFVMRGSFNQTLVLGLFRQESGNTCHFLPRTLSLCSSLQPIGSPHLAWERKTPFPICVIEQEGGKKIHPLQTYSTQCPGLLLHMGRNEWQIAVRVLSFAIWQQALVGDWTPLFRIWGCLTPVVLSFEVPAKMQSELGMLHWIPC